MVKMRFQAVLLSGLAVLAAAVPGPVRSAEVTIVKPAAEANPAVCVASFDGPAAIKGLLEQTLQRCDWFSVVDNPRGAAYVLDCKCGTAGTPALEVGISTGGRETAVVRQSGSPGQENWMVFRTVDAVIQRVFRNPGLCASKIAFAVGGSQRKEVFTCLFDGTGARQVTHNGSISTEPSWGPGGSTMLYTVYEHNATSVVLIDMVNQRQRRLSRFPGLNSAARFSPDRRWVAMTLSRDGRVELYLMEVQTGKVQRLTNDAAVESSPCWSPDGRRICFVSDRGGRPSLYLIPMGGGTATRILNDAYESVEPDWSTVSNKICFSTSTGGNYVLAVVDMNNPSGPRRVVVNAAGDWESPSWAPDGRHVVCAHSSGGRRELSMVDTWHGRIIGITSPSDHSLPSWSPLF